MANKPLLYLLSGNGSTKSWWEDTLPYFSEIQAIPLELPGFGDNPSSSYNSLDQLAEALIDMTEKDSEIFAVGVNGLVVLRALVLEPHHFSKVSLLAPVGAFLWERRFVRFMSKKPIRATIHFLLRNFPRIFRKKFSSQTWTSAQYARMGEGYRKCRAFQRYFEVVKAENALDFTDRITTPIELIWGTRDAVLNKEQVIAWDSILPRAALSVSIKEDWGHYPYIDDPVEFAEYIQARHIGFRAHGKGGRLRLAELGGVRVPALHIVHTIDDFEEIRSKLNSECLYALRSSNLGEDQIDQSQAGLNQTFLRVPLSEVPGRLREFFDSGMAEVVVQEFVDPVISGVAFARHISMEVEWVEGHLEKLLDGTQQGHRFIASDMNGDWELAPKAKFPAYESAFKQILPQLRECLRLFHYQASDMEWAWDGKQFYLLQIRPVSAYAWHRCLTSANLDEILPKQVSRLMEEAQRLASPHIGRVMGRWDRRVFRDNEPFTVAYADASYINSDLFLSRFSDWGLPSQMYANEIGGAVPYLPLRLGRFVVNLPIFLKMGFAGRKGLKEIMPQLQDFEKELIEIPRKYGDDVPAKEAALLRYFARYYLFIVRSNILINMAVSTSLGSFFGKGKTVYQTLDPESSPHRLQFESDPATPRPKVSPLPLSPFPDWKGWQKFLHRIGAPGMRGIYIEVREWFRDNNMRLFHRLHQEMGDSEWLEPYPSSRTMQGTFWEDGGSALSQDFSFVIYPGKVEGVLGENILVVDALEPGHYAAYQQADAIISRTGGRLSHGATLLRELKKPSAVISDFPAESLGKSVKFENGAVAYR